MWRSGVSFPIKFTFRSMCRKDGSSFVVMTTFEILAKLQTATAAIQELQEMLEEGE